MAFHNSFMGTDQKLTFHVIHPLCSLTTETEAVYNENYKQCIASKNLFGSKRGSWRDQGALPFLAPSSLALSDM
ncbi:hypothetical protein PARA125_001852 [Parachlamydia sp. AcF125]|nr:hypothetical protein [Parachlamydia sp. AcF125]